MWVARSFYVSFVAPPPASGPLFLTPLERCVEKS